MVIFNQMHNIIALDLVDAHDNITIPKEEKDDVILVDHDNTGHYVMQSNDSKMDVDDENSLETFIDSILNVPKYEETNMKDELKQMVKRQQDQKSSQKNHR